jgi:non-specific serine/threonine protein kinase
MLTFLQHKVNNSDSFTALVVVPTSLLFNWENEIGKFAPDMKYLVHSGLTRKREVDHFSDYNIVITSYGVLRRDVSFFRDFEFDYVILDESQAIKNPLAQTSKAMKLLRAKNRLVMTGTPVENSVFDLFSQFDFLNPGMLGSLEAFRWQYAAQIDRELDEEALVRLRKLIYPFVLNRKKNQVAKELPEKSETVVYCEMDEEQRKVYRNYQMRVRKELDEMMKEQGVAASSLHILQAFTKLRQICNSPRLLADDLQDQHLVDGVKMNVLLEQLEALVNEGHKVLVFSFFTSMLKLVEEKLNAKSISHVKITGDTVDRKGKVDSFQEDESIKVFLISLKAGGTGLNLTAADYVYIIDPWWNPAVEQQAIDRTHRIGQTKQIFAYKLICKDSIEEKMLQLQEQKKSLVTELISGDQGWMKKLTREDVMELLNA